VNGLGPETGVTQNAVRYLDGAAEGGNVDDQSVRVVGSVFDPASGFIVEAAGPPDDAMRAQNGGMPVIRAIDHSKDRFRYADVKVKGETVDLDSGMAECELAGERSVSPIGDCRFNLMCLDQPQRRNGEEQRQGGQDAR